MIRTLCVVGAALAISVGTAGVALADPPENDANAGADAGVSAGASVNADVDVNVGASASATPSADPTPDPIVRGSCQAYAEAGVFDIPRSDSRYKRELDRDRDGLACERGGEGPAPDWDRDHRDRDRRGAPVIVVADCDNDKVVQLRYRNEWRGFADRYTLTLREAKRVNSDGGTRVTDAEWRRIKPEYDGWHNHRTLWLNATSKRKLDCKDDGGDTSVINVEAPPVEVNYTAPKTSSSRSSSSGGQVSTVPDGPVDTGDGSTEIG